MRRAPLVTFMSAAFLVAYEAPRGEKLQRLFSSFPRGLPGLGLLLLRAAVGGVLIAEGASVLAYANNSIFQNAILPLLEVLTGASLLVGFITPIGGVLAMLLTAGMALWWLPHTPISVVETKQVLVIIAVMAAALALLGPGAFSVDSLLFGRREIVIPRVRRPPEP